MRRHRHLSFWAIALAVVMASAGAARTAERDNPPPGAMDPATRETVIAAVMQTLREEYIFPESAVAMGRAVHANQKNGKSRASRTAPPSRRCSPRTCAR